MLSQTKLLFEFIWVNHIYYMLYVFCFKTNIPSNSREEKLVWCSVFWDVWPSLAGGLGADWEGFSQKTYCKILMVMLPLISSLNIIWLFHLIRKMALKTKIFGKACHWKISKKFRFSQSFCKIISTFIQTNSNTFILQGSS